MDISTSNHSDLDGQPIVSNSDLVKIAGDGIDVCAAVTAHSDISSLPEDEEAQDQGSNSFTSRSMPGVPSADAKMVCPLCSKLMLKRTLPRHLRTVHGLQRSNSFLCATCGKYFPRKDNLRRHVMKKHTAVNTLVECAFCKRRVGERSLKEHRQSQVCIAAKELSAESYSTPTERLPAIWMDTTGRFDIGAALDLIDIVTKLWVALYSHSSSTVQQSGPDSNRSIYESLYVENSVSARVTLYSLRALVFRTFLRRMDFVKTAMQDGLVWALAAMVVIDGVLNLQTDRYCHIKALKRLVPGKICSIRPSSNAWTDLNKKRLLGFGYRDGKDRSWWETRTAGSWWTHDGPACASDWVRTERGYRQKEWSSMQTLEPDSGGLVNSLSYTWNGEMKTTKSLPSVRLKETLPIVGAAATMPNLERFLECKALAANCSSQCILPVGADQIYDDLHHGGTKAFSRTAFPSPYLLEIHGVSGLDALEMQQQQQQQQEQRRFESLFAMLR